MSDRIYGNGDASKDENEISDDCFEPAHGVPKDREGLAERDPEYLVDDRFLKGMLNGLAEAKKLANILLENEEKSKQVLQSSTKNTLKI